MVNPNLDILLDDDANLHELAEKSINDKIQEFYPGFEYYVKIDENNPVPNFYAPSRKSGKKALKLSESYFIRLVYSILSDQDLDRFKLFLRTTLDHEAQHMKNDGINDELNAQVYALSRAADPLDALSMQIAVYSHLHGVSPEVGLEAQLNYWGILKHKNPFRSSITKARTDIIEKAKIYANCLADKSDSIAHNSLKLPQRVISWSQTYI